MVDRGLFEAYDEALAVNAGLVARAVQALAPRVEGAPPEALPSLLLNGYAALARTYGGVAAAVAVDFYMRQRGISAAPGDFTARQYLGEVDAMLELDVGQALRAGGGDAVAAARHLRGTAIQRVMECADRTLMGNARRDPARPKWALVPHATACPWCRFLGSQGFRYNNEARALASRHPNCTCTPVIDFDVKSPALDGYDPDGLFDEYAEARAAVEADARESWEAMTARERAAHARPGKNAYQVYLRNRIIGAMDR